MGAGGRKKGWGWNRHECLVDPGRYLLRLQGQQLVSKRAVVAESARPVLVKPISGGTAFTSQQPREHDSKWHLGGKEVFQSLCCLCVYFCILARTTVEAASRVSLIGQRSWNSGNVYVVFGLETVGHNLQWECGNVRRLFAAYTVNPRYNKIVLFEMSLHSKCFMVPTVARSEQITQLLTKYRL